MDKHRGVKMVGGCKGGGKVFLGGLWLIEESGDVK